LRATTAHAGRIETNGLSVDPAFHAFIENELLPAIDGEAAAFWSGLASIVDDLTPVNRRLLRERDEFQQKIDAWHAAHPGFEHAEYVDFLVDIGYLREQGEPFEIETANVDPEVASMAGPQLVVPISNARFAINASNARWGSLYDALYSSDVIDEAGGRERGDSYNPARGAAVIEYATGFLDGSVPLDGASHADVEKYEVLDGTLVAALVGGQVKGLRDTAQFAGCRADGCEHGFLLVNNGLHVEIVTNAEHPVGRLAPGQVADVVLEAAITTIQDC
jgi:malate synthase